MMPSRAFAFNRFLCSSVFFCGLFFCGALPVCGQPPRDTVRNPPPGTASISGAVVSDESQPRPLRRARVMLNGAALPVGRTLITNDDGTFVFEGLPAGRYTVGAAKDGYVAMNHGATRTGRPGSAIVVPEGGSHRVSLRLPRGSVITGTITTPDGQPMPSVAVTAMFDRFMPATGERRLTSAAVNPNVTDDRGAYRIYGLPAGDYLVSASVRMMSPITGELQRLTDADIRRAMSEVKSPKGGSTAAVAEPRRSVTYAPVFFPGTPNVSQATVVSVGKGEERTGVDIQLAHVPTSRIEGMVFSPRPVQGINVSLAAGTPFTGGLNVQAEVLRMQRRVDPDGRFSIPGVPPGRYTVMASSWIPAASQGAQPAILTASTEVVADGEDISNVMLTLQPGLTISGRVVFEGAQPPAVDLTTLRVNFPLVLSRPTAGLFPAVQLDAGGRFTINGVSSGMFRISDGIKGLRTPVGRWWVKSVAVDGRELLDRPLELRQSTADAVVTFSDRASTLSGMVTDAQGGAAADAWLLVFSADSGAWFHNSRRVAGVRLGADGRYTVRNLPAGEYYVTALADVEQGEWFDPELLRKLAGGAVRIAVGEYEQKTADVIIR